MKESSATDEPPPLAPQKPEGKQGWYLKNYNENNENNEIIQKYNRQIKKNNRHRPIEWIPREKS